MICPNPDGWITREPPSNDEELAGEEEPPSRPPWLACDQCGNAGGFHGPRCPERERRGDDSTKAVDQVIDEEIEF